MKRIIASAAVAFVFVVGAFASSANAATFNADLTIGSTGSDVVALQSWLVERGFLTMPAGVSMGYFGQLTKTAVAAYQATVGLPTTGFVGPMTRGKLNGSAQGPVSTGCPAGALFNPSTGASCTVTTTVAGCTAGAVFSSTTGARCDGSSTSNNGSTALNGTDGSISDVNELSQYASEEVGEGESDVKIAGFEVEASNDGDIALRSMKISFNSTGNTGSDNLDDYIDSVGIWMGNTKIGEADAEDFNEDSSTEVSKTITLKSGTIVRADEIEKFYISVDAVGNLDSGDISGDSWTVDVENIRFEDGSGVTSTDNSTGDIPGLDVPFDFVSFSSAADTELKLSKDTSSPDADIVVIDDTDNTDDVVLLVGKIKLDGTSDVVVDELPVTLTTSGGANVAAVANSLKLQIGDEEYTETVDITGAVTGTITFDNLDFTVEAGETVKFTILADINDIDSGNLDEGDTLTASVTSTNRDYMDVENEEGDQLSDSTEKSGTATGDAQEFRTNGIALTHVSSATSVAAGTSANDDQGTFTIKFKVKAIGDTVYVSSLADAQLSGNTSGKTTVHVDRAGTATVGGVSVVLNNITDTDLTSVGNYMIEEGEEETFELTTTVQLPTAGSGGLYKAALGGVRWGTTDVYPLTNSYTSNLDEFKTSYVGLN